MTEKTCTKCKQSKPETEFSLEEKWTKGHRHSKCKKCCQILSREWRKNNPEHERASMRKWYLANKEKAIQDSKNWKRNNRESYLKSSRKTSKKIGSTQHGRLCNRMRGGIRESLSGSKNGRHWQELVGYTVEDIRKHIESLFTKDMSWERFMAGEIHIDHIIPVSFFKFNKPEDVEFRMCWRLENLQPLWKCDNLVKHNKILRMAV